MQNNLCVKRHAINRPGGLAHTGNLHVHVIVDNYRELYLQIHKS